MMTGKAAPQGWLGEWSADGRRIAARSLKARAALLRVEANSDRPNTPRCVTIVGLRSGYVASAIDEAANLLDAKADALLANDGLIHHRGRPMVDLEELRRVTEDAIRWLNDEDLAGAMDSYVEALEPEVTLHLLDLLATQRKALEEARAQLLVLYTTIARGDAESGARFAANDPAFQKIEAALEASHV